VSFTVIGKLESVETIAEGSGIREITRLRKVYGDGNWKKKKGFAIIRLDTGETCRAEVHWYEAHGIGKMEHKIKRLL
jgi:hypothetical protein